MTEQDCNCWDCCQARYEAQPERTLEAQIAAGLVMFHVCTTCGNKRCPKAKNHDNACTNSNKPGQKGSAYE